MPELEFWFTGTALFLAVSCAFACCVAVFAIREMISEWKFRILMLAAIGIGFFGWKTAAQQEKDSAMLRDDIRRVADNLNIEKTGQSAPALASEILKRLKEPPPDVHLMFVYPENPSSLLYDVSSTPAENAISSFGMWNLNSPPDQLMEPLRIISTKSDYVRPHESNGPNLIFDVPGVKERLKPGDQLFGFVNVSCARCLKTRQYWLSIKWGTGGWYAELPEGRYIDLVALSKKIPEIAKYPEQAFSALNVGEKHSIMTWDELKTAKPPQ